MKRFFSAFVFIMISSVIMFAQTTTGRLIGTVSGPDGLLPGASVTVTDTQTNREFTAVADSDGSFQFAQLSFGVYTVRISQPGFKTFVATDVKIDANREYSLKPVLEVGSVEVEVTVQAGVDLVNSTNAELSTTVSPRQVLELPINGRNPLALLNLQAGVNATSNSINGQRSSSANYTRDGVNVQDNFIRTGGFVQDRPTVDDTGEFAVITQNAGANFGGGGSTQVLLVTPRGGREFHGALFAYNRNSEFAANTFGNNASNTERPFLNRNQFGGKISGPAWIPGFGEGTPAWHKDKAFFFASYERFLLRQTTPLTRRVLLAPFRDGTFSYRDTGGVLRTVNVLTGAGLTGPIPASQGGVLGVDPVIQSRFLALTPTVGNGDLQNTGTAGSLTQSFIFNQNDNDTRNGFTGRFDVDLNDRNNVYFVYKYNDNKDDRQTDGGGFDKVPFGTQGGPTDFYLLSYNATLGSNFTNEVRGAFNRSKPFFNQADSFPTNYLIRGLPLGLSSPEPSFQKQGRDTGQYTFQDNASYIWGNHAFRFGADFNAQRITSQTNFNAVPIYNITTTGNTLTPRLTATLFPGGISAADRTLADNLRYLLGGIVGSGTVAANFVGPGTGAVIGAPSRQKFEYETIGLYIADQWRVSSELTLNLGLRWDHFTPLRNPDQVYLEPDLRGANTIEEIRAAVTDPTGQYVFLGTNSGKPGQFFKPDYNNFGPNISFAYAPRKLGGVLGGLFGRDGQTVIRGGFRLGYINDEYVRSADNAAGANAGLNFTLRANNAANVNARFSSLPAFPAPPAITVPITFATGNARAGNFFNTVFAIDPNLQTQQNMEYNFGITREIGWDTAIEVRYVGGRSNSLVRGVDYNQVDVRAGGFLNDFITARNNCRILQASLNQPLALCADATGSQGLPGQSTSMPVFASLPFGGLLTNTAVTGPIAQGNAADLAILYVINGLDGTVPFLPNTFAGPADVLINGGKYRYNSLQAEIRRRFTNGLSFQANYTFQKILSDVQSDGQARFDPYLDNNQPGVENGRADYDRTHTINVNAIYELPFGKGKKFLNSGGIMNSIFGGWQVTSIVNVSSGAPLSIKDPDGTLNRAARSGRQTAFSNLTSDEIKKLIGIFKVNGKIYFINPSVIGPDGSATNGNLLTAPNSSFPGQVFFSVQPGQTGNLPRNFFNGPWYINWDAGLIKNIAFNERMRLQLRAEAFNVLNHTNYFIADNSAIFDIESTTFGQIAPTSTFSPRIMQFAVRFEF
ncbi:MAG: TonB-dependent receptor [Acidobacteriota bacterium]